jgi:Holliday junction resolvase RusA-like endonuclease
MQIVIYGQPITSKNSINLVDIGKQCPCCRRKAKSIPLPSTAFKRYEKAAKEQLRLYSGKYIGPVEVSCKYWLQTAREPDLTNLMEATHDILEHAGIIDNDKNIKSVDGSRIMGKDATNPRVEITIRKYSLGEAP